MLGRGPGNILGQISSSAQHSGLRCRPLYTLCSFMDFVNLVLKWIRSHLSFLLSVFIFLKNALGFWYINVYFFWSSFPFASQPLLRVCSVAEALPFAWHVLFCLTWSLTARVGHCLHFSCEGTTPQKGQVTCPRFHGLYVVQNTDSNPKWSDSLAQKELTWNSEWTASIAPYYVCPCFLH